MQQLALDEGRQIMRGISTRQFGQVTSPTRRRRQQNRQCAVA
jgi:hypothetical protein